MSWQYTVFLLVGLALFNKNLAPALLPCLSLAPYLSRRARLQPACPPCPSGLARLHKFPDSWRLCFKYRQKMSNFTYGRQMQCATYSLD